MYWEQLNEVGSNDSGLSRKTIPTGTYYLRNMYPSSHYYHPLYYNIAEQIEGSYTDSYNGNGGDYNKIELGGHNGSIEMPVAQVVLKQDDTVVASWDGYYMSSYSPQLIISHDTEVSSLFYDVFIGLTQY
jgi:hypothetical protein